MCSDEIRAGIGTAETALETVGALLQNAQPQSSVWATEITREMQRLRRQLEAADAKPYLDTPPTCEKAYNLYLSGLYPLTEMSDEGDQFLDKAVKHAKSANRYFEQAVEEVVRITP